MREDDFGKIQFLNSLGFGAGDAQVLSHNVRLNSLYFLNENNVDIVWPNSGQ